ncbi:hypothetical protein EXIGLDRAFT_253765 [Exidia glandulosa HHB12029]|uniref:Uncharacterized protein n=1 Tax=Exidia glandulosa HHB12029 TaxID=1314781 RepID=A0A165DX51_EXIGL|nr:hypothetical protein EXIGLDRAFT_253765 [Exidia glandulosa HHB12029]
MTSTALRHREFDANITLEDAPGPLTVYKPNASDKSPTASGWIESKPGQAFKITVKQLTPSDAGAPRIAFSQSP